MYRELSKRDNFQEVEGNISSTDRINTDHISTNHLDYNASGTGHLDLTGSVNTQNLEASGYIDYKGLIFISQNTSIDISGTATIKYGGPPSLSKKTKGFVNWK